MISMPTPRPEESSGDRINQECELLEQRMNLIIGDFGLRESIAILEAMIDTIKDRL